jgi:exonuclease VII small subunit
MAKEKSKNLSIFIAVAVILVLATGFLTYSYTLNQSSSSQENTLNFFKEYSVALNNIHVASGLFDIASLNLDAGNSYVETGEYYYEFAIDYYDTGKEQVLDAKELLNKAKTKLQNLQNNAPNSFFQEDVEKRIEQADSLISVSNDLYSLLDYQKQQLYEINYGSESKATEYYNKYNTLIPEFNNKLKKLSEIQNQIDLNWDQDWYPTFQETATA